MYALLELDRFIERKLLAIDLKLLISRAVVLVSKEKRDEDHQKTVKISEVEIVEHCNSPFAPNDFVIFLREQFMIYFIFPKRIAFQCFTDRGLRRGEDFLELEAEREKIKAAQIKIFDAIVRNKHEI